MSWDWLTILTFFGIGYAILYTSSKLIFSFMSLLEIRVYFWRYDHIIEEHELDAHLKKNKHELPLISIISPAYNEGVLIIDTVSSFLNQAYKHKEIIICSDGGTDNTLDKLIEHFELEEVPDTFVHSPNIEHKPVRRYLKSKNPKFKDLIVIDKENGGKADAQNSGVAIAKGEIITIIDADSILEKYALIHLADLFERERRVVGIGTPIGVVNDCHVGPDGVDDASVPKSFWAKIQVIEYMRSFLLGRMFAQRFRGLQIVSGAFGVYKKWIVEAVGGYSTGSLAEDMDIDAKIWRYIDTNKLNYRIRYIPEAFCWSEVPNNFKSLVSQRDRWARGMTQTIWKNKDLFFNPKFKMLGLFSFPYYVFFEWLTPFIEIGGLLYFIIGASLGWFSFYVLEYIFLAYWVIGLFLNILALSVEAATRGHYKNRMTLVRLSFYAILEPLFYHWINSFLYVIGNLRLLLFRQTGWGKMQRVALHKIPGSISHSGEALEPVPVPVAKSATRWFHVAGIGLVTILAAGATWYFVYFVPNQKHLLEQKQATIITTSTQTSHQGKPGITHYTDSAGTIISTPVDPFISIPDDAQKIPANEASLTISMIDTLADSTGRYYVIVASLIKQENLTNFVYRLNNKGFRVQIIPSFGKRKFNLVSIESGETFFDAASKMEAFKPDYGNDIWILKY